MKYENLKENTRNSLYTMLMGAMIGASLILLVGCQSYIPKQSIPDSQYAGYHFQTGKKGEQPSKVWNTGNWTIIDNDYYIWLEK